MTGERANARTRPANALITGGAVRLGAAIAEALADAGVNLVIHHHQSDEAASQLAETLARPGVNIVPLAADLTDAEATKSLFADAAEALGPIDLLVNNASIFENDTPAEADETLFDAHYAIHVKAPSLLAAAMHLQKGLQRGLVVNIIDQRVWKLTPEFYSYTLSKSALWTATRTLAQAFAPILRVNAIAPGPTLPGERQSAADFNAQTDSLPLGRGPELGEFGETILYLWRAGSVTGQMIALDGGQHLAWQTPDVTGVRE